VTSGSSISGETTRPSDIPRPRHLRASNITVHLPATGGPSKGSNDLASCTLL
jgi:hypothetical protein